jgi:hypothetical protein
LLAFKNRINDTETAYYADKEDAFDMRKNFKPRNPKKGKKKQDDGSAATETHI